MKHYEVTIDPDKIDYNHIASEIVRGMTNNSLDLEQEKALLYVAKNVMINKLKFSTDKIKDKIKNC